MSTAGALGQVITFYSYKGGTGRTMALANLAYLLASNDESRRVLMVDWDLEAPGLHRYALDLMRQRLAAESMREIETRPGLIELFMEMERLVGSESAIAPDSALENIRFGDHVLVTDHRNLHLLKAGCFDARYAASVGTFPWEALHTRAPWLLPAFGRFLAQRYDYVLIDARTGLTDAGGICTSLLPDTLVIVFTPNRQSLLGGLDVARSAGNYRRASDDLRPLRILPLPSRIEPAEPQLRERWRFGDTDLGIPGYQPAFEQLFVELYDLPECDLGAYFDDVQVQHLPRFAYGEEIAAKVEPADRLSLTRSFEHVLQRVVGEDPPWKEFAPPQPETFAEPVADEAWLLEKRGAALNQLATLGIPGMMEASFFVSPALPSLAAQQLFKAAQAAQVPGTGWPIGAVLTTSPESRPHISPEGLSAEIIDPRTGSYDYWVLRADGAFYFVRNLEEEREYLLADDRVARMAELLMYCKRLYTLLGADRRAKVLISVGFRGLNGRALGSRMPDAPEMLQRLTKSCIQDSAQAEVVTQLATIQADIDPLVDVLTAPLFALFDFYRFPMADREQVIRRNLADWGFSPAPQAKGGAHAGFTAKM